MAELRWADGELPADEEEAAYLRELRSQRQFFVIAEKGGLFASYPLGARDANEAAAHVAANYLPVGAHVVSVTLAPWEEVRE